MRFRFGECLLDLGSRELKRAGVRQNLSPRAFQLLELLIGARPRALSKQELHDRLWPDAFVSDSSLPRLATELRAALGDNAREPRLVRTIHRYGYGFCGDVITEAQGPAPAPPGHVVWGGRHVSLLPGENVLGRAWEARVWIDVGRVSRHHARIVITEDKAVLEDLGSRNGTFLRGQRLTSPTELKDGDVVGIGPVRLVFRTSPGTDTTEPGTSQ